ncbi:MAG: BTAD domain-containing putative transcriptional regulator, partial [Solirubrobacteraceae bacterium]
MTDVSRFSALAASGDDAEALALYHGPFLDGFVLPGCVEFDQWVAAQRARLQGIAARSLERLATAAESRADWTGAVAPLKQLVALDTLSATATMRLMRATWASGDRPGAIQLGRVHATIVREQLDLEPDVAVLRLMDELRGTRDTPAALQLASELESAARVPAVADLLTVPRRSSDRRVWRRAGPRAAAVALVAAVAGGAAVILSRSVGASAAATTLSAQQIVVAPFRVSAADASLSYLREGIVELLSSRLADDSAARAVDPGRVLGTWRAANPNGATDTPNPEALKLARRLGASRVVVGGVVGNPSRIVVTASVLGVPNGETRAKSEVEGSADSITTLVDRLAVRLVATSAGEGDRFSDRFTPSLGALRDFLDGQAAYHRGDYAAAVPLYEHALARDSSFALAAMHLALAADRLNAAEQHDRALAIAWTNRNDLN